MNEFEKPATQHDSILLVMKQEKVEKLMPVLSSAIAQYNVNIRIENSGISGINRFLQILPCMVLIDNELDDITGLSTAAIIKEAVLKEQYVCAVYVSGVTNFVEHIRADRIFSPIENEGEKLIIASIKAYLENRANHLARSEEIKRAKNNQREMIPNPFFNNNFEIIPVFSPFHELSGDGIDYWYSEAENKLFGFVFDCTGHDLVSFLQSGEIRAMLRGAFRFYQIKFYKALDGVMKAVNDQLFDLYHEKCVPVACVIFEFDFTTQKLRFCPAGIPNYLVKDQKELDRKEIPLESFLLGFMEGVEYETFEEPLDNLEEIIFSTDGFSELLQCNQMGGPARTKAKHDDVSAVIIHLIKK